MPTRIIWRPSGKGPREAIFGGCCLKGQALPFASFTLQFTMASVALSLHIRLLVIWKIHVVGGVCQGSVRFSIHDVGISREIPKVADALSCSMQQGSSFRTA